MIILLLTLWGEIMLEVLKDSLIDVLKIIPFLFIAFIILEYIEHKISKKNEKLLIKNQKYGPIIGGLLGSFPQCGFSAMVTKLFSSRVVTLGTLIAVYLSTSDEMLPILITNGTSIIIILKIIGIKVVIGIIVGIIIDLLYKKNNLHKDIIHDECMDEHCHCEKGIIHSSIHHTINITVYLLITILILNYVVYFVGEDNIKEFMLNNRAYYISSLIGLIPNCASSVIMTEIYLTDMISFGSLMSGLLTGAGVGLLLLFKTNKNFKENILVVVILYLIGVIFGYLIDFVGIVI